MRLPIRLTLPILIVFPIFAAVGLGGWFSYHNEQQVVRELAEEMSRKATDSIERHIYGHLAESKILYQTMMAILEGNPSIVDGSSPEVLTDTLWNLVQQPDLPNRMFFGNTKGDFLGFSQDREGDWTIQLRTEDTVPNRVTYRLDDQRNPTELVQTQTYDPRVRVWYTEALETGEFSWSPVYAFATEPMLGVTAAQPIYDSEEELRGVFGLDVSLASLGHFLEDLEISPSGHAFVMERSGELIATSMNTELFKIVNQQKRRILATDSSNALIRDISSQLLDEMGNFSTITTAKEFVLTVAGMDQYIGVTTILDPAGIDWIVVVIVPSSDFNSIAIASLRSTIQVGLLVAVGASIMGMLVARWITLPIQRLTRAACLIEGETFTPDILDPVTRRGDELGRLARIVQAMGQVVMSRQQSLQQQLQQLKQENAQQSLRNAQLTSLGNVSVWHSLIGQSRALRNAMAIAHRPPLPERLKAITYFADFTLEQRQRLLEFGEERWVDGGTDICTLGERGNELYFVIDGEAAMLTDDEPPRYLTTIDPGEVVGEFSLLLDIPRVATIRAIAPTTLFAMNREGLRQLLKEHPHLEDRILETLQQRQAERQMLFRTLTVIQDPTIEQPSQNYLEWLRDRLKRLIAGTL